ncbi:MAG: glycoside hydrolase family 99-like domain-containing protein [Pseudomonadota bacterium]
MIYIKRRQLLVGAGSAVASSLLPSAAFAAPSSRTLIAAYFGGWKVPMDPSQRGVHGDNPWGSYPTTTLPGVTHNMKAYPGRFPVEGPWPNGYDESQQSVIDGEIKTASSYGIDVFAMNWYRDEFLNHPIVNFKKSPNKGLMKFFLQWSNTANVSKAPPSDSREYFFEGIRRAAVHMKGESSYWKQDNRPVFAIYDVAQIDRIIKLTHNLPATYNYVSAAEATAMHDAFLQDCHNIVTNVLAGDSTGGITGKLNAAVVSIGGVAGKINKSGVSSTFKPSMYLMVGTSDVGNWARCVGVAGMYVYNIRQGVFNGTRRLTHSFAEMMTACQQNYDLVIPAMKNYAPGKVWWPTLMTGFNQKPWGGTTADPLHDNSMPKDAAEFAAHATQVRNVLRNNPTTTNNTVFIYAWNELGEGGWLTPTPDIGTTRLAALRDNIKNKE